MKKNRPSYIFALSSIVVMIAGFFSLIWAQAESFGSSLDNKSGKYPKAMTVPVSRTKITVEIKVDNNEPVLATQFEGGMIRIEKGSYIFGFTPYISEQDTQTIAVSAFRITRVMKKGAVIGERIQDIQTLRTDTLSDPGLTQVSMDDVSFTLKVMEVQKESASGDEMDLQRKDIRPLDVGNCCVYCENVRYCACAVIAPCGGCCYGDCCGPGVGGNNS